MLTFVLSVTASNPLFQSFEKSFAGQIIDPDDLIIKEQIGQGECDIIHDNYM